MVVHNSTLCRGEFLFYVIDKWNKRLTFGVGWSVLRLLFLFFTVLSMPLFTPCLSCQRGRCGADEAGGGGGAARSVVEKMFVRLSFVQLGYGNSAYGVFFLSFFFLLLLVSIVSNCLCHSFPCKLIH